MLLLRSIPRSMTAEVAIKISLGRSNAANVNPLIAPPVPNNPAVIPDKVPPLNEFINVGFTDKCLKINNSKLIEIKNTDREICNNLVSKNLLKKAPIITKIMAGIPILMISFQSTPFLKNAIFEILLDR